MSLFCIHPFRDETKALPNTKNVRVNRKGLFSQAKKKETVKGLRSDPFEAAHRFLDFLVIHLFQEKKTQSPFPSFDPMKDSTDAPRFLLS